MMRMGGGRERTTGWDGKEQINADAPHSNMPGSWWQFTAVNLSKDRSADPVSPRESLERRTCRTGRHQHPFMYNSTVG